MTPIFPAIRDWHAPDPDVFWGPSIHYNAHLGCYVMLLNRAIDPHWKQEGIYISYNSDITDPQSWSPLQKILETGVWYPQIIGLDSQKRETDKLCGRAARFFLRGDSDREILFLRPGERPD